jgi:uncharacterized membrane protein
MSWNAFEEWVDALLITVLIVWFFGGLVYFTVTIGWPFVAFVVALAWGTRLVKSKL